MTENLLPTKVKSRRMVIEGSDVFVKETELAPGDTMPFHHHSSVRDIFYCLAGELSIDRADVFTGETLTTVTLASGDSITVKPGTAHRPHNRSSNDTRFLLIQGVGKYDYILYNKV